MARPVMETRNTKRNSGGSSMKEQKIVSFLKRDGKRTSITLSHYQLIVLDRLAKYLGVSRTKLLNDILDTYSIVYKNMSTCVKDEIIGILVKLLITKGIEL